MTETGADDALLEARLATIEAALDTALGAKIAALGAELEARIEAKLSGGILATKSGALIASLALEPEDETDATMMSVVSRGVPYARMREQGGKTAAHDIVAVKARALAFVAGGKSVFAKIVHHPGSQIPPHEFMAGTLDEMHDAIVGELTDAVLEIIRMA